MGFTEQEERNFLLLMEGHKAAHFSDDECSIKLARPLSKIEKFLERVVGS